jgi:hypothetical protein
MLKSLITTLLFISLTLLSCSNLAGTDDELYFEIQDSYTFYVSKEKADYAEHNRGEEMSDPFYIEDAWISLADGKKYLNIELVQEEGCSESYPEKYEVIWSGVTITIYPPQLPLFIGFDNSGCTELESGVSDILSIDLYDHFDNKEYADSATYIIVNTSTEEQEPIKVVQSDSQD